MQSFYYNVPRQLRNIPVVEYLFGSHSANLYDVIFEVEDSREFNLFSDMDHDEDSLLSPLVPATCPPSTTPQSPPRTSSLMPDDNRSSRSPRRRKVSTLTPLEETSSNATVLSLETTTPIAKLFGRFKPSLPTLKFEHSGSADSDGDKGLQRLQALLEECRELPVNKLRDEVKELQVRKSVRDSDQPSNL